MFNSTVKYAKLAWVYTKGICGFRHKEYDLRFVYEPEDKLWYIDMWWPGDRYNLAMVAGSNHLLTYLDSEVKKKVRVLVRPSKKKMLDLEGFFECKKQYSGLLAGATYKINGLDGFSKEIWICPVTLTVLGCYPKYIYIKQLNEDGTISNLGEKKERALLLDSKIADINVSVKTLNICNKLHIETLRDLLRTSKMEYQKVGGWAISEVMDIMDALGLKWS